MKKPFGEMVKEKTDAAAAREKDKDKARAKQLDEVAATILTSMETTAQANLDEARQQLQMTEEELTFVQRTIDRLIPGMTVFS